MAFEVCAQRTYKLETKSDMKEVVEGEMWGEVNVRSRGSF